MSKFKLNQNWNGHYAGEEVSYPDMFDKIILLKNIGVKVEPKAENKMIVPDYPNVKKARKKKA